MPVHYQPKSLWAPRGRAQPHPPPPPPGTSPTSLPLPLPQPISATLQQPPSPPRLPLASEFPASPLLTVRQRSCSPTPSWLSVPSLRGSHLRGVDPPHPTRSLSPSRSSPTNKAPDVDELPSAAMAVATLASPRGPDLSGEGFLLDLIRKREVEVQKDLARARREVLEIRESLESAEGQISEHRRKEAALESRIEYLEAQLQSKADHREREMLGALAKERRKADEEIASLVSTVEQLRSQLAERSLPADRLLIPPTSHPTMADVERHRQNEAIERLAKALADKEDHLRKRDGEVEEMTEQIAALKAAHCKKVLHLEDELSTLRSGNPSHLHQELKAKETALRDKEETVRLRTKDLSDAMLRIRELEGQLQEKREEVAPLEERAREQKERLEEAHGRMSHMEVGLVQNAEQLIKLQSSLREEQEKRADLEVQLQDTSIRLRKAEADGWVDWAAGDLPREQECRASEIYKKCASHLPVAVNASGEHGVSRAALIHMLSPNPLLSEVLFRDLGDGGAVSLQEWLRWLQRRNREGIGGAEAMLVWLEAVQAGEEADPRVVGLKDEVATLRRGIADRDAALCEMGLSKKEAAWRTPRDDHLPPDVERRATSVFISIFGAGADTMPTVGGLAQLAGDAGLDGPVTQGLLSDALLAGKPGKASDHHVTLPDWLSAVLFIHTLSPSAAVGLLQSLDSSDSSAAPSLASRTASPTPRHVGLPREVEANVVNLYHGLAEDRCRVLKRDVIEAGGHWARPMVEAAVQQLRHDEETGEVALCDLLDWVGALEAQRGLLGLEVVDWMLQQLEEDRLAFNRALDTPWVKESPLMKLPPEALHDALSTDLRLRSGHAYREILRFARLRGQGKAVVSRGWLLRVLDGNEVLSDLRGDLHGNVGLGEWLSWVARLVAFNPTAAKGVVQWLEAKLRAVGMGKDEAVSLPRDVALPPPHKVVGGPLLVELTSLRSHVAELEALALSLLPPPAREAPVQRQDVSPRNPEVRSGHGAWLVRSARDPYGPSADHPVGYLQQGSALMSPYVSTDPPFVSPPRSATCSPPLAT